MFKDELEKDLDKAYRDLKNSKHVSDRQRLLAQMERLVWAHFYVVKNQAILSCAAEKQELSPQDQRRLDLLHEARPCESSEEPAGE